MAAPPPPAALLDELIEEVLLRLPPDDPACLVRSSAVCKPWRTIFALPRFRRRYCEFHGTPPLLGYFHSGANFVPTATLLPAQPDRPDWIALDCRHGRALLAPWYRDEEEEEPFELIVVELVSGHQSRVPSPVPLKAFCASVLCAAQGCDHHGCHGEHFLVALVSTNLRIAQVTSGWLYSSETRVWSQFTSLHHTDVKCAAHMGARSVLVGDALYFQIHAIIKCHLGTLSFSVFEKPIAGDGRLMTPEDGGLVFAAVVGVRNLTLWSMETGPEGAMGWAKFRIINLEALLRDDLSVPTLEYGISSPLRAIVSGAAEGTQVIFVTTDECCYMVDLNIMSGRVTTVSCSGKRILPYMGFYIPVKLLVEVFGKLEFLEQVLLDQRGGRSSSDVGHVTFVDLVYGTLFNNGSGFYGPGAMNRVFQVFCKQLELPEQGFGSMGRW